MSQGEIIRASDVYGVTRDLPMNYVSRKAVDDELVSALTRDQHMVIYGSSKQGKDFSAEVSSARRRIHCCHRQQ